MICSLHLKADSHSTFSRLISVTPNWNFKKACVCRNEVSYRLCVAGAKPLPIKLVKNRKGKN